MVVIVKKLSMLVSDTMFDMRELDPDDVRPPYVQVATALRGDIDDGTFPPGAKLPSHQDLCERFGVSLGTVKRALGELQGGGLIVSRQGQGAFVRTKQVGAGRDESGEIDRLRRQVEDVLRRLEALERQVAANGSSCRPAE